MNIPNSADSMNQMNQVTNPMSECAMQTVHFSENATVAVRGVAAEQSRAVREVVIVDPQCDRYSDFVQAAEAGRLGLHFCVDGRSALQLARRFRADAWLVAAELPDVSGLDLVSMLSGRVMQAEVDPLLAGSRMSLDRLGERMRPAIFLVADAYRLEDEQQALASGVAAYMVGPLVPDLVVGGRVQAPGEGS